MNLHSFQACFQEDLYPESKQNFIQYDQNIDLFFADGYESAESAFLSNSSLSFDSYGSECLEAKRRPTQIMKYTKTSTKKSRAISSGAQSLEEENDETPSNEASESSPFPEDWSEEKDQILLKLGAQYKGEWKKLAKRFSQKHVTPRFLKNRYKELTFAPIQRRMKFAPTEDLMLVKYFEKYGPNWKQISTHFENRTPVMLKNRYYSFIKKKNLLDTLSQQVKTLEENNTCSTGFTNKDLQRESSLEYGSFNSLNCFAKQSIFSDVNHGCENFSITKEPLFLPNCMSSEDKVGEYNEVAALRQQVQILTSLLFQTRNELIDLKVRINSSQLVQS